ncbi:MAG: WecB/TagA/CpsF family glycosyltransferase [Eubacteriales bacterium]|jgi:N-acetylglucosaminyldiphosphoundecaprenol N-acetyl-beta-D-mannosaminyltransferase
MEALPFENVYIHGVRIERTSGAGALDFICRRLQEEGAGLPLAVFTPNAEIVCRAAKDERLLKLVNSSDINLPDGVGVVWAASLLGSKLPGRIPGIELGEAVLGRCAENRAGVFLLGGRPGVAEVAALRLSDRFSGLEVLGKHHGYFDTSGPENREIVRQIAELKPGVLVVCLGFPRQEEWIISNRAKLPDVKVMLALGGSLDVWAGRVRRAPGLFRSAGLEWLWRVTTQPARLVRTASLLTFVGLTLRERRRIQHAGEPPLL